MARSGFGTVVTHSSSFFAEITNIELSGQERSVYESTHLATATTSNDVAIRTYEVSDLAEPGSLEFTMYYNPDNPPPQYASPETITLTFPVPRGKSKGATKTGMALMTASGVSVPMDGLMTSTATLKWLGAVTDTASS